MKDSWFGDSYDIVKRYFISELKAIGYHVVFDPSFMTEMNDAEQFYRFVGASDLHEGKTGKTAIVLDPDTGIGKKRRKTTHVSVACIVEKTDKYNIVPTFDQSFSWSTSNQKQMERKLTEIRKRGRYGFYYNSHASFLLFVFMRSWTVNRSLLSASYSTLRSSRRACVTLKRSWN
ncbi:MAG: hypothetical protein MI924_15110 [Chloroflexales bacterium]|nr:hypothetical protein [Chloroflexales bacterium]